MQSRVSGLREIEVRGLKTRQKVRGGKKGIRKQSSNSSTGKARGGETVEVAGGRPWVGVFVLLRAVGCIGWHLGGTEAGRAEMGMTREGLWLG